MKKINQKSGSILIQAFFFGIISVIIIGALVSWANGNIKASKASVVRESALQIAEAGIDYYRWHLAHAPNDFKDGNATSSGPYVHNFYNKDGVKIGTFTLTITPPQTGSTLVKIKSTGSLLVEASTTRSILVKMAIPSLAKYAIVSNDNIRFGQGTEIFGLVHSNRGVRFDGLAHNLVTSAMDKYNDPDHNGVDEYGVHTHVNIPPSTGVSDSGISSELVSSGSVTDRPDVFEIGRKFPVPAVDFTGMTSNLSQIKSLAQSSGIYISNSGVKGYHLIFKTNNTFDLYKVNTLTSPPNNQCKNNGNGQNNWDTWSINTQTFVNNYIIPASGIVFIEDNLWVDGQINNSRVTIGAGVFPDTPSKRPSVTINDNLLYTNYDGRDVIGLISQGDVNIGLNSPDNLRIDSALVAQNGRVGRNYYSSDCGTGYVRNSITLYGTLISNVRYGFAYSDNTGYINRSINYDANLLYAPPPSFPLVSNQYQIISWEEQ